MVIWNCELRGKSEHNLCEKSRWPCWSTHTLLTPFKSPAKKHNALCEPMLLHLTKSRCKESMASLIMINFIINFINISTCTFQKMVLNSWELTNTYLSLAFLITSIALYLGRYNTGTTIKTGHRQYVPQRHGIWWCSCLENEPPISNGIFHTQNLGPGTP